MNKQASVNQVFKRTVQLPYKNKELSKAVYKRMIVHYEYLKIGIQTHRKHTG